MDDTAGRDISRNEYLFHHLVAMFQTLALQQLGKLLNPITNSVERDLQQARITIDMLQMIRDKTAGNLTGQERTLLEGVVMELQLNYVDELKREEREAGARTPEDAEAEKVERESAREQDSADRGADKPRTDAADGAGAEIERPSSGRRSTRGKRTKTKRARTDTKNR